MKTKHIPGIAAALALGVLLVALGAAMSDKPSPSGQSQDTKELWKKVEEAEKNGLPQTAVDSLKQIVTAAFAQKNNGEALRALTRQIILESSIKGNKPEERVVRLQDEIGKAPEAVRPMMKLILAQWYWHYYSRNRWRFLNRTATAGLDEKDFTTWDLPKIFREIDRLYRDILKDEAALKKTRISGYKDLLAPGNQPVTFRPTLYDFVVFEALDFYSSGEQTAARPEDAFVPEASSAVLGPASEFLKYAPETTDLASPKLQALKLFQGVLAFHREDASVEAFLDADLQRLRYARSAAAGEEASARYIQCLKDIVQTYAGSTLSSQACYLWAQEIFDQGDYVQAFEIATRGLKTHPKTLGAGNCEALLTQITEKEFDLRCEAVLPPKEAAKVTVNYRNLGELYFRVVKENFAALLSGKDGESLFWMSDDRIRRLIAAKPVAEWKSGLKPTFDYKTRTALLDVPALEPGYYRILAGAGEKFDMPRNKIQAASFWVSELGLVTRGKDASVQGYVMRNQAGEPVPSAEAVFYQWDYNSDTFKRQGTARTDDFGYFSIPNPQTYSNRLITVKDGRGAELAEIEVPSSYARRDEPQTMTLFFTDRSLFRPGQTISFKGICLSLDRSRDNYRLLARQKARVVFRDANRQEIANLNLVTNEFGSFSGTFVAPTDRLTGEMTISTENPRGSASVRVEEYKRPKFQVKLEVPDQEFRLNDGVAFPGEAMAYTGAPVDGAQVKYRIVREVQYPWWWWFYGSEGSRGGQSQEIGHGTVRTDELGKFNIAFKAKPDPAVAASSGPIFTFAAYVDVTDPTGETRSASGRIRAGFASLEAGLNCADWQEQGKPVVLTITTATLNGKRAGTKGTVEVFALQGPGKPVPADLIGETSVNEPSEGQIRPGKGTSRTSDWRKWPEGKLEERKEFQTDVKDATPCLLSFSLKPGAYKARLKTKDKFGTAVESQAYFLVLDPIGTRFPVMVPFHTASRSGALDIGGTYELLWGTGYDKGPVLIEIFQNDTWLKRFWTSADDTQGIVRVPVDEKLRGGFTVLLTAVKNNRHYSVQQRVSVPWTNKALELQWQTFRSKLKPGQDETWSLRIRGPQAALRAAEMVAALYDVSLDQFTGHGFPGMSGIFRTDGTYVAPHFTNRGEDFRTFIDNLNSRLFVTRPSYIRFQSDIGEDAWGYGYPAVMKMAGRPNMAMREAADAAPAPTAPAARGGKDAGEGGVVGGVQGGVVEQAKKAPDVDLSKVQARKNLNETAFFFPHLLTDANGVVTLEFKMPEALTEWRFLGFAHTKDLESGSLEARTVTQKNLMVQPNPPRFLREGDRLEFTVKVTNMTEKEAQGAVQLSFFDPQTEKSLDAALANATAKIPFTVPAKQSRSFSWTVAVPDGLDIAGFKAVAATAEFSDGEEGVVPVLSRRIFVRESIPLWINDQGEKPFTFDKLVKSEGSTTLQHKGLVVQMASNPAWYAVQALPYLMEYPYECSEQVFNRLYANGLAQTIAKANPKIRKIFDQWKGTPALKSNLEKNEDLKSVLLQESPWVLEAKAESQAKQNVGLLFDENRMADEIKRAFGKLAAMQLGDGAWPWFPGGRGDSYITLYIVTGFGRLKQMAVTAVPQAPAVKALGHLDGWINDVYEDILRLGHKEDNHLSSTIALYLYGRSFYLKDQPIPNSSRAAVDYFLKQAAQYWLQLDIRQSQAHLALGLNRFGDTAAAQKIMRSMKERSRVDEELGRFWSDLELSWWWYRAPIETQAVMIEAFDEVMNDQKAVEECKVWLLKQKQTQDWKTTKATADAVYGLLRRGADLLASDAIVEVRLGGKAVEPEKVEAGTGFYEKRFEPAAITPAMGRIVVAKTDKGIAWGGVHWQYMEDIGKITPHAQNPLKLKKSVFVQRLTKAGPVIEAVTDALAAGDMLIIRIELRTDRDMEYVHMKDHRGSGLEPVNVLSQYKYQGGLIYYESTKDTATHFFIDYLPKGTYVFEYPLRVVHRGAYHNGMAHIECMYAPEFNSHSESVKLEIK